jgi:CheY-like chemotaxis protein
VLIVDDDRSMLALLGQYLRQAGFRVVTANDPMQGLASAIRDQPAVVVSDLQMPAGGGDTLLRRLQASSRTSGIPVVVVSGSLGPDGRERLQAAGVAAILIKPVEAKSLVAAVAVAIGAGPAGP